jgi:type I restriction enzyme M protein
MLCAPSRRGTRRSGSSAALSEALLAHFGGARLLDAYDVYQHLMDFWAESMQDDVYLVVAEGWTEAARLRPLAEDRAGKTRPDLVVGRKKYRAELIPPALVIARFFAAEKAEVDRLEAEAATAAQAMEDYAEEHGGEDGALAEARNERDVVTPKAAAARLKALSAADADDADERAALDEYLRLAKVAASAEEKADAKRLALTEAVVSRYGTLTDDQVKTLVVEDKWLAAVEKAVEGELARVGQTLGGRLRALGERYARPLPALVEDVDALAARVAGHLARMGAG